MGIALLAGELLRLRQKTLRLARLRRVGSDAAGFRAKAVLVVGAHRRRIGKNNRKPDI
jgi:hypothetical protein